MDYICTKLNLQDKEARLASLFTLLMFAFSGLSKLADPTKEASRFASVTLVPMSFAFPLILLVGAYEIVATYIIWQETVFDSNSQTYINSQIAVKSLIVFTVLATLIFYANPFRLIFKLRPFLSNLSTIGALLYLSVILR